MRSRLERYQGQRLRFRAVYIADGNSGKGYSGKPQFLLRNLTLEAEFLCDHVWIQPTSYLRHLNLKYGDVIEFDALVVGYARKNRSRDYKIDALLRVERIYNLADGEQQPLVPRLGT